MISIRGPARKQRRGVGSDYLLNPDRNIALWARWVNERFSIEHRDGIASAVMKHQAGPGNVDRWNDYWARVGAEDDLEYQIETAPRPATRNFVRRVLRDITIVDAAEMFSDPSGR